MATQTSLPYSNASQSEFEALERPKGLIVRSDIPAHLAPSPVLTTLYSFPTLEPLKFIHYPPTHLGLPLRRDILHRAVIFEGDMTRQGTASTKWRAEVHGSGRKIRPQKGTGKARLGDKKSPMLRGGGVAFGPQPRDFSTGLNKKVYDMAWRTALSYRYKKGELVVVDSLDTLRTKDKHWLNWCFENLKWGSKHGRSLMITEGDIGRLVYTFNKECGGHGRVRSMDEVDVKNLLEMKRVVIEKSALNKILRRHQSDLKVPSGYRRGLTTGADAAAMEQIVEELEDDEA
jgi:large subunit ribosomal protein L4